MNARINILSKRCFRLSLVFVSVFSLFASQSVAQDDASLCVSPRLVTVGSVDPVSAEHLLEALVTYSRSGQSPLSAHDIYDDALEVFAWLAPCAAHAGLLTAATEDAQSLPESSVDRMRHLPNIAKRYFACGQRDLARQLLSEAEGLIWAASENGLRQSLIVGDYEYSI